jgi:hypothetical protein
MGEVEAKKDRVTRHEFRHDRYTGSLLTDHLVFSPKYRGKVFEGGEKEKALKTGYMIYYSLYKTFHAHRLRS